MRLTTKEQLEKRIDEFITNFCGNKYSVENWNVIKDRWNNDVVVGDKVDFPNKKHGLTTATVMKIIRVSKSRDGIPEWRMPKTFVLLKTLKGQWVTHESNPTLFTNIIKIERGLG